MHFKTKTAVLGWTGPEISGTALFLSQFLQGVLTPWLMQQIFTTLYAVFNKEDNRHAIFRNVKAQTPLKAA